MISSSDGVKTASSGYILRQRISCYHLFCLCLSLVLVSCHCRRLLSQPYLLENLTLFANNASFSGLVDDGVDKIYTLDAEECVAGGPVLAIAFETSPTYLSEADTSKYSNLQYSLMLNTDGVIPIPSNHSGTVVASTGIWNQGLASCGVFSGLKEINALKDKSACRQSFVIMKKKIIDLDKDKFPWYIGVSSVGGSLNFNMRAWCLSLVEDESEQENLCVRVGTIRCSDTLSDLSCPSEHISISTGGSEHRDALSLDYGDWKYFTFDVPENQTRILVEMSRSHGDMILFLKPEGVASAPPSEFDIDKYADKYGFENRLSYHHRFAIGTGRFYIGIFNNDACVQEVSYFNLTISTASSQSSDSLCPMNCSYPNGECVSDNVCKCEDGYGGHLCEGSLQSPTFHEKLAGQLSPGQVAYFQLNHTDLNAHKDVSMKFARNGSNTVLLAKKGGFPSLTNYSMKFADISDNGNLSDFLEDKVGPEALSEEDLIFAVFNVDYIVHQISFYNIILIVPGNKTLSSWVILLVAICSSLCVCFLAAIVKKILQQNNEGNIDQAMGPFDARGAAESMVNEEGGLDKAFIEKFPSLYYEEGIVSKEEALCSICLSEYSPEELLRKIPLCSHVFHLECIDKWLDSNSSCPLCRVLLVESDAYHGGETTDSSLHVGGTLSMESYLPGP